MNAGANGNETCDHLEEVTFVDERGGVKLFSKEDLSFRYRWSSFHEMRGVIASAKFKLALDENARKMQLKIVDYRIQTQPLKEASCGCVFQNPKGEVAGKLIEQCGLKGKRIGGAEVSSLHANFIINQKSATAKDVLTLAKYVKDRVKEKTGIELTMELRAISHD